MFDRSPKPKMRAPVPSRAPDHSIAQPVQRASSVPFELGTIPLHPPGGRPRPKQVGLPERLKAGVEAPSGVAMDDVRERYRAPEPARFGTLAFAKGDDIHLGTGQREADRSGREALRTVADGGPSAKPLPFSSMSTTVQMTSSWWNTIKRAGSYAAAGAAIGALGGAVLPVFGMATGGMVGATLGALGGLVGSSDQAATPNKKKKKRNKTKKGQSNNVPPHQQQASETTGIKDPGSATISAQQQQELPNMSPTSLEPPPMLPSPSPRLEDQKPEVKADKDWGFPDALNISHEASGDGSYPHKHLQHLINHFPGKINMQVGFYEGGNIEMMSGAENNIDKMKELARQNRGRVRLKITPGRDATRTASPTRYHHITVRNVMSADEDGSSVTSVASNERLINNIIDHQKHKLTDDGQLHIQASGRPYWGFRPSNGKNIADAEDARPSDFVKLHTEGLREIPQGYRDSIPVLKNKTALNLSETKKTQTLARVFEREDYQGDDWNTPKPIMFPGAIPFDHSKRLEAEKTKREGEVVAESRRATGLDASAPASREEIDEHNEAMRLVATLGHIQPPRNHGRPTGPTTVTGPRGKEEVEDEQ